MSVSAPTSSHHLRLPTRSELIRAAVWPRLLPIGDALCVWGTLIAAVEAATLYAPAGWVPAGRFDTGLTAARLLLVLAVFAFFLSRAGLFLRENYAAPRAAISRTLLASASALTLLATLAVLFPPATLGRWVFIFHSLSVVPVLALWRLAASYQLRAVRDSVPTVVLGANRLGAEIWKELALGNDNVLGLVRLNSEPLDPAIGRKPVLGTKDDLLEICEGNGVQRIVVAPAHHDRAALPMADLLRLRDLGVEVLNGVDVYERLTGRVLADRLDPEWWFGRAHFQQPLERVLSRLMSAVLSVLVLILASPFLAIVALLVKVTSKGPIFYGQERVGLGGRTFKMLKFRTMRQDAEAKTGPVWSVENDPRVTRIGRILRRTRIDELPQLWNVAVGDMNLIGPRPERPHFVAELTKKYPLFQYRHLVRPGITGWAQVTQGYTASEDDAFQKLLYDLYYVKNASPRVDLEIILGSIITVITGRGAR